MSLVSGFESSIENSLGASRGWAHFFLKESRKILSNSQEIERGGQNERVTVEAGYYNRSVPAPQEISHLMTAVTLKVIKSCIAIAHTSVALQGSLITSNMKWNYSWYYI